jgi:phosphatidylglycerol lysyltransferase
VKTAVIYAGSVAASQRAQRHLHPSYQSREQSPASVASLAEAAVARWGRSSVSPFLVGADRTVIRLGAGAAGYVRQGRWAVLPTDAAAPVDAEADALAELLEVLARERLRPVFACVTDPEPYRNRGMHAVAIADDAVIELRSFSLSGGRRANVRHSVSAARRAGIVIAPFSAEWADGAAAVSAAWLATKRGGEMAFTLGRFDHEHLGRADCRVAVDAEGRVVGLVSWHRYDAGRARVLDLMRRAPDAPNSTMDALIAESLVGFAAAGVERASLSCVPLTRGPLAESLYPTASLRRYKDKFAPAWEQRWLVVPTRRQLLGGLLAVTRSYCAGGLVRGLRHN